MVHRSAIIFDFDGTLTKPHLDFDLIRAEIGNVEGPLLEAFAQLDGAQRARAESILERHERQAAEEGALQDGAAQTLARLRRLGYPLAILTRNARRWVEVMLGRFDITLDAMRTRDDGAIKPSPEPVLSLCEELGAHPHQSWMIGDHLFDILTGINAGTKTVLVRGDPPARHPNMDEAVARADYVIETLVELPDLVQQG
jgi:HAD superfamily hydrolase (TIGR01549 family)